MKIASNRISAIISYFHKELSQLYPKEEIESLIFLCFEQYLNFTRTDLILKANDTINESDLLKFSFAVKDLKKNIPIQYILGNAWFCDLLFEVNNKVLIPRQETEELVLAIVKSVVNPNKSTPVILDIGTGSGCIAVALKAKLPAATVYALDVSAEALEIAYLNAAKNKTAIQFIQADILDTAKSNILPDGLDIIVSNPPYVKYAEMADMHKNVLDNEPHLALFVPDNDALVFYKAIANIAITRLNKGGQLFFEINETLGKEVIQLLSENDFKRIELLKDINGKDRMVRCIKI